MSEKYKVRDQSKLYFVTFAVGYWIDVFTRPEYKEILVSSLIHCQENKGLEIYGWCIMSNHVHLIVGTNGKNKIEDTIRDFKKYTSVHVCKAIESNVQESRREWMLWMFSRLASKSKKHTKYSFWQNEYHPIELSTNEMMNQKLNYIHENPVKEGIVYNAEDYMYSSAIDYAGGKGKIDVSFIE